MNLALSAARMECGSRFEEIRRCVMERGSIGTISEFLKLCLQLGHYVDGTAAVRCLDGLDARRSEDRWKWEYRERWFQWDELLELMIFGGKPIEAATRLLTYDTNTKDYSLRRNLGALGACGHEDALAALMLLKEHCARYHAAGEWAGAVAGLATIEAGEALLTFLLEGTKLRDSYGGRELALAIATIAEESQLLRGRILELARSGEPQALKVVGEVVRHIRSEGFMSEVIATPALAVRQLEGAIGDALRKICIEDRPIEGASGAFNRVPRAIPDLRAKLFARVVAADEASPTCARLLQVIDDWREGYDDPADEPRHPDLLQGQPWPPIAQSVWDEASKYRSAT